jgi:hypothetical protein
MKVCTFCEILKPLEMFYSQIKQSKKRGEYIYYHPECKDCTMAQSTKWRKDNPERYSEINVKRNRDEHRVLHRREHSRKRAKEGKTKEWQDNNKDKVTGYARERQQHKTHEISKMQWIYCKTFFENECAHCGLHIDDHFRMYGGKLQKCDLHKEHVDHDGSNRIDNCVPSCNVCNSSKHASEFEEWYSLDGRGKEVYSEDRKQKIMNWLNEDHKKYI